MSSPRDWVVDLAEVGLDDHRLVGAKAWRLARLLQAGFPVSPGFCLTAPACAAWDDDIRGALLAAYGRMGGGPVAVRSSAIEEDGETASYAGVYGSELPVEGETRLLAALERCRASWHEGSARDYRARVGAAAGAGLAILVQRLVPAIAAGVAYTRDPLKPQSREVHIDAVWGLAEPLAAGRVAPDSLVLTRRGRLLRQNVADKPVAMTAAGSLALPPEKSGAPSLSPADARQVVRLALRAEAFFGAPQDVEFAIAEDGPWIVQSRPIVLARPADSPLETYLESERRRLKRKFASLKRRGILQGKEGILSNGNVGELLPTPTPMSFGLFRDIFAGPGGAVVAGRQRLGYRFDPRQAEHLYELVAGQVYFNLEVDAATFDYGASPAVDFYLDRVIADQRLANYPEVHLYRQHHSPESARTCFGAARAAAAVARSLAFDRGMTEAARQFLERYPAALPALPAARRPWSETWAPTAARSVARRIKRLRTGLCVEFVVAARLGFYFAARLRERLLDCLGESAESLCAPLLSGLAGSLVTEQAIALESVLAGDLQREDFLAAYGHTADNELELSEPRLIETPAKLDAMLHDLAASGRSPAAEFARQQCQRIEAEARLEARLAAAGVSGEARAALLSDLHLAQRLLPLRETIKHHYTAVYADIRLGLLHLAACLGCEAELIFHLRPQELLQATRDPERWLARAESRRGDRSLALEAARRRLLPDVVFASRLEAIGALPPAPAGSGWQGSGLSPGRAWGVARVVDASQAYGGEFSGDEILVLRAANLGLAPLFRLVAGVVVEVGGLLAHSACQAREAGIPAVLLPGATGLIADGSRLMIDGGTGAVSLVPAENSEIRNELQDDLDLAPV